VATESAAEAFVLESSHDLLREIVEKVCSDAANRALGDEDVRRHIWRALADLDVLGAPLPTDVHGGGGGPVELMVIMHAIGKHLAALPYIPTIVCAGQLIADVGSEAQIDGLLTPIIAGQHTVAFCAFEQGDRGQVTRLTTKAVPDRGGYRITGTKLAVIGADQCDSLLVVAELADRPGQYAAFFVNPDAPGVICEHRRTIDGLAAAEISLTDVYVDLDARLGPAEGISEQLECVYDLAAMGLCAEACGSLEAVFESTVEYVKTREQFGQPVATFQVVQHRIVDMGGLLEQATAITHWAASSFGLSVSTRRRAVAAAKAYVGKAARTVTQSAVQLHGAIGTTDELALSRHLRRIEVFNTQFGTEHDSVRRYMAAFDTSPLASQTDERVAVR
jgi:alkylation response protein AidB-like acyl-CoA dehydrogenase